MKIRSATAGDIARCIDIRSKTRQNAVSAARLAELGITETSWAAQVSSGELLGHIGELDDEVVGYCFGSSVTGEIVVLALLPAYENQGLGAQLLRAAMDDLHARGHRRLFLGCSDNPAHRSHGFYRHLGWRSTGASDAFGDEVLAYVFPA